MNAETLARYLINAAADYDITSGGNSVARDYANHFNDAGKYANNAGDIETGALLARVSEIMKREFGIK